MTKGNIMHIRHTNDENKPEFYWAYLNKSWKKVNANHIEIFHIQYSTDEERERTIIINMLRTHIAHYYSDFKNLYDLMLPRIENHYKYI